MQHVYTLEEHHKLCSTCHLIKGEGTCKHCHKREGEAEPAPFTHAQTGWPLSSAHQKIGCRTCHKNMPFQALDPTCSKCHSEDDWKPGTFDHAVTGRKLDESHAEIDCEMCHTDRNFAKPPTCNECHSDWDGDSFDHKVTGQALDETHNEINCETCHVERRFYAPPACNECHDADEVSFPSKRPGEFVGKKAS